MTAKSVTMLSLLKGEIHALKRMCFLFVIISLLMATDALSQQTIPPPDAFSNGLLPNIVSASPEVASLGKYGTWPVSEYTGIPNISIPVYTINIKDFSLPITLNYHAGGVKVDEMSSWVGVNWSLSAGGMIGRTVMGIADDDPNGLAYQLQSGLHLKSYYDLGNPVDYYFLKQMADSPPTGDTEGDIYYYNFGGLSGKFFMDSTFNIHTIPASNLQFLYTPFSTFQGISLPAGQPPCRWIIADEKGNIYKFAADELTRAGTNAIGSGGVDGQGNEVTGTYLTQIILANKADTINFQYGAKQEIYYLPSTQSCRALLNYVELPAITSGSDYNQVYQTNKIVYGSLKKSYTTGTSKLKSISWRGGSINFYDGTVRQDMISNTGPGGNMLDSIVIANSSGSKIKSVGLKYLYIGDRYFLDSLLEFGSTGSSNPPYQFSYNNVSLLPERNFSAPTYFCPQDHWGFYNGPSSPSLLPPSANMPAIVTSILNGKREPDTVAMQYGTLNKIIYPTGGYTQFTYESNRYNPNTPVGGGAPAAPIVNLSSTVQCSTVSPYYRSVTFQVPFTQNNASLQLVVNNYGNPTTASAAPLPYVMIMQDSYQAYYNDAHNAFPASGATTNSNGYFNYTVTIPNLQLLSGITYTIIVGDTCLKPWSCTDPDGNPYPGGMPSITATMFYSGYGSPPPSNPGTLPLPIAGGLRIKQITNYNYDGIIASNKTFQYDPGNLIIYPSDYTHQYDVDVRGVAPSNVFADVYAKFIEETSTAQTIPGLTQGATVGYTHVTERDIDNSNNDDGYTSYYFSFTPDSLNASVFDPIYWPSQLPASTTIPTNSFDYKRGLLLSQSTYKNYNQNYIKIDSISNAYVFNDYNSPNHYYRQHSLRVNRLRFFQTWASTVTVQGHLWPCGGSSLDANTGTCLTDPAFTTPDFSYTYYDNITSWIEKVATTNVHYDQNGKNPVFKTTLYQYNTQNLLPNKTSTSNSKGEYIISNITYPVDYTITGTPTNNMAIGIQYLQNNHIIDLPIEQFVQKSNLDGSNLRTISSVFTSYKASAPYPDTIFRVGNAQPMTDFVPAAISASGSSKDSRYEPRATFNQYDVYGNILERQKSGDVKEVYLWGYSSQYPVTKIVGSDYATVSSVVTQAQIDNAISTGNDQSLSNVLNTLRTDPRTANALVTTYTFSPLIGITSQTDPAGHSMYYTYDSFGRLSYIKDQDGNIIKKYDYHYQGQP